MAVRLWAQKLITRYSYGVCAPLKTSIRQPHVLFPRQQNTEETLNVLCRLPKLSIYSSMEEGRRRGLHNITKNSKTLPTCRMVSGVSASCVVARTGWGVYKLLFRSSGSPLLSTLKRFRFLLKVPQQILMSRSSEWPKNTSGTRMLRHCAGDYNSGKRWTNLKWQRRPDMLCAFLKRPRAVTMVESEWDLRRSFLLQNIDWHVSWSAALSSFRSRFEVYKYSITVSAAFFLSSTTSSFGIKTLWDCTNVLSGLESPSKSLSTLTNVLFAGLNAPESPYFLSYVLLKRHKNEHMPTMSRCDLKKGINDLMRKMSARFISSIPQSREWWSMSRFSA